MHAPHNGARELEAPEVNWRLHLQRPIQKGLILFVSTKPLLVVHVLRQPDRNASISRIGFWEVDPDGWKLSRKAMLATKAAKVGRKIECVRYSEELCDDVLSTPPSRVAGN
jgi:hypothetical protein